MIKIGTVCSGVEAPIVALETMGVEFDHVYSCELDDKCVDVISQKFSPVTIYRDMWDLSQMNDIPYCDILVAGLPCQAFSAIGFQKGLEDERGILFRALTEIMRKSKPKYVVFENVRNMIKHDNGNSFREICDAFHSIGYNITYKILKTSDYGIPQNRSRVYGVCYREGDEDGMNYMFPAPCGLKITLDDILGGNAEREIGYTVRVGGRLSAIGDRHNWDGYIVDGREMRIGSAEAAMLQGFPRDFYDGTGISENEAMKQMGNTMSVPVVGMVIGNLLFNGEKLITKSKKNFQPS
jgi:DNA (cytosine-5)-methyltransferase 1